MNEGWFSLLPLARSASGDALPLLAAWQVVQQDLASGLQVRKPVAS